MEMIEIQAFVAIADCGTFTRAAASLHISQPAISRRIELLERELDAPLFERLPAGVRLTAAGRAFLPFAHGVLANAGDGVAAVRAVRDGDRGTITLALVGTLASTSLIEQLAGFRDAHPEIRLLLRTARSSEVGTLVERGDAALGLRYFEDTSRSLMSRAVATEKLVVVRAAASRLVPAEVPGPGALAGVPWVTFPTGMGSSGEPFATALERLLIPLGLGEGERILIDSLTAQKRMIESDFGIGLMPLSAVTEEVRLGSLRMLALEGVTASVPIHLVRREGGFVSGAMRSLMTALNADR